MKKACFAYFTSRSLIKNCIDCLFTNDYVSCGSCPMAKVADDTTVESLITYNDDSVYRQKLDHLGTWSGESRIQLNVSKTKEMVIADFWRGGHMERHIVNCEAIEQVDFSRFWGPLSPVTLAETLIWCLSLRRPGHKFTCTWVCEVCYIVVILSLAGFHVSYQQCVTFMKLQITPDYKGKYSF